MLSVYALMLLKSASRGIDKNIALIFLSITLASLLGTVITNGTHSILFSHVASEFTKLLLLLFFLIFYQAIYKLCNSSFQELFAQYLKVSTFFASVGIAQEAIYISTKIDILQAISPGSKNYEHFLGVAGLSVEPAFFACALLPGAAYHVSRFVQSFKISKSGVAIIFAVAASTSSLGYLGLFLSIAITLLSEFKLRRIGVLLGTIPIALIFSYQAFSTDFFQTRYNDTLAVLDGTRLTMQGGMNMSTYSNAVNTSIALRSFRDNYGVGAGFGAYSSVYDRYIDDYEKPTYRDDIPGRGSATSMFARLTAELGLIGWALIAYAIYALAHNIRSRVMISINIAYLSTFAIILLRMGEYYANGVLLVFMAAYLLHKEMKKEVAKGQNKI